MRKLLQGGIIAAAIALTGGFAHAACEPGKSVDDMTYEDAQKVYECISDALVKGYSKKKDKRWIPWEKFADYRNWTRVSKLPANPGFHTGRFLVTWVNDVGADAYMKYEEKPDIPAGTLIAKESFTITDKGKVRRGPLFLMEKVAAGKSSKTMDWYYMMVNQNGVPMAVDVPTACNTCHMENYGHQGALGYPVEEVRVTR